MSNATPIATSILDILWNAQTETEKGGRTKPAVTETQGIARYDGRDPIYMDKASFTIDTPLGRFLFEIQELDDTVWTR